MREKKEIKAEKKEKKKRLKRGGRFGEVVGSDILLITLMDSFCAYFFTNSSNFM